MKLQGLRQLAVAPDPLVRDFALLITAAVGIDQNQDGNVDLGEGLAFGQKAVSIVIVRYSTFLESIEQLKNVNDERRKELIEVFADNLDLPNQQVEDVLEDTIRYIERTATDGYELAMRWASLGKEEEPVTA